MNVKTAEIKEVSIKPTSEKDSFILIKFNNGFNTFTALIKRPKLCFEDIVNHNVKLEVIFLKNTCCSKFPIIMLDSDVAEQKEESMDLIDKLLSILGEEIKASIA